QIARTGQVLELLDKDAVESFVVAPREDIGCVVGEAQNAQAFLGVIIKVLAAEGAFAHVFAKVRRIGATAAVADDEDEAALQIALVNHVRERVDFLWIDLLQFPSSPFEKSPGIEFDS